MTTVQTERRGRSIVITINRPEVRYSVGGETAGRLLEAVEAFHQDDSINVLILTGAGELAFCSGADLKNIGSLGNRPRTEESGPMGINRITAPAQANDKCRRLPLSRSRS